MSFWVWEFSLSSLNKTDKLKHPPPIISFLLKKTFHTTSGKAGFVSHAFPCCLAVIYLWIRNGIREYSAQSWLGVSPRLPASDHDRPWSHPFRALAMMKGSGSGDHSVTMSDRNCWGPPEQQMLGTKTLWKSLGSTDLTGGKEVHRK